MQRMTALFSAALLSLGLAATQVQAQEEGAANAAGTPQAAASAQDFSDAQLQQFADASKEIAAISQEYTQQLQAAEGDEAQQSVRKEANDEMVQAVQDSGLEVDTFNAIGQAIQQNPELMQRVQEMANTGADAGDQAS